MPAGGSGAPTTSTSIPVEVRFARQLTRIPDAVVAGSDEPGRHWFAPTEIVLAIEIESPGSHVEDRTIKPALYAQHGIAFYWRIELDPLQATVYRLGEDGRQVVGPGRGTRLQVAEPFPRCLRGAVSGPPRQGAGGCRAAPGRQRPDPLPSRGR